MTLSAPWFGNSHVGHNRENPIVDFLQFTWSYSVSTCFNPSHNGKLVLVNYIDSSKWLQSNWCIGDGSIYNTYIIRILVNAPYSNTKDWPTNNRILIVVLHHQDWWSSSIAFHPPARLPKSEKLLEFKLENGFCGSANRNSALFHLSKLYHYLAAASHPKTKKKQSKAVLNILVSNMEIIFTIAGFFLSTQTLRCIL